MSRASEEFFQKGYEFFQKGETLAALYNFEKSYSLDSSNLLCKSFVALLMATERGQLGKATDIMEEIAGKDLPEPLIYLNLGRLYLLAGKKIEAIEIIRKGLTYGPLPEAVELLEDLGSRKKPFIPSLPRSNFINKYIGLLFKKLRIG